MPLVTNKPKVLVFIDWFLPGYKAGGPIRSVANLINQLKSYFEFHIVTTNTDSGEEIPYSNIKSNNWNTIAGDYLVYYFSKDKLSANKIREIIIANDYKYIYLNSLFSKYFSIIPILICKQYKLNPKIILAPRGMLGKAALKIKAHKKKMFLFVLNRLNYFKNITWHASDEQEKMEILAGISNFAEVKIAANFPTLTNNSHIKKEKLEGELKLIFFSRITSKKNLHFALELLKIWNPKNKISFDIIGPIEDSNYWQRCQKTISQLPSNIVINYLGSLENESLIQKLKEYHFFFFPSLHENFGHVIFEALSCSLPLIISNNTFWKNLGEKGAGWDLDLGAKVDWIRVLDRCLKMNNSEYCKISMSAFSLAQSFSNDPGILASNKSLFS